MIDRPIKKDEWALVLDFLARGHQGMQRSEPVAQVLGDKYFSLLEVITKEDASFKPEDRVYIGDGKRSDVKDSHDRYSTVKAGRAPQDPMQTPEKQKATPKDGLSAGNVWLPDLGSNQGPAD